MCTGPAVTLWNRTAFLVYFANFIPCGKGIKMCIMYIEYNYTLVHVDGPRCQLSGIDRHRHRWPHCCASTFLSGPDTPSTYQITGQHLRYPVNLSDNRSISQISEQFLQFSGPDTRSTSHIPDQSGQISDQPFLSGGDTSEAVLVKRNNLPMFSFPVL